MIIHFMNTFMYRIHKKKRKKKEQKRREKKHKEENCT